MKMFKYLARVAVKFLLFLSLISAQFHDCPLPDDTTIECQLETLLCMGDGGTDCQNCHEIFYDPNITEPVHYVCQAQGSARDTYRTVSIIATYTHTDRATQTTMIFQLECTTGPTWVVVNTDGLDVPDASVMNGTTRTDCVQCREDFGLDRCGGIKLIF